MNQISLFEAKVANGNGEQTLSRDVYRLGRQFDFYRMLSFYFTTVGFYFSSMVCEIYPCFVIKQFAQSVFENDKSQSLDQPTDPFINQSGYFPTDNVGQYG